MARAGYEGRTNVYWVVTIANKNAPTAAEIAAGTALTNFVTKDGVRPGMTTNKVDNATIAERFDAQAVGSFGADFELEMFRSDPPDPDTAWNLAVVDTAGFIVIDRQRASGTLPVATNKVEVWPATMHQKVMQNSASNTMKRFVLPFAITSAPVLDATVA